MPAKKYATIPIGLGDEDPLFMAIDDASRIGYVATVSSAGGSGYTVATVDPLGRRKQWALPSTFKAAEDTADLSPSSVNADGLTVGTAIRAPVESRGRRSC
jgi:hypothetical protein